MLILSLFLFFAYCIAVCGIAYHAWKEKACGDMLFWFFFVAIIAGFIGEVVVVCNLPDPDGTKVIRVSAPANNVIFDCTDPSINSERLSRMESFMNECKRNTEFSTCTDKAKTLFCKPVKIDSLTRSR